MNFDPKSEALMSVGDLAKKLNVSVPTVYRFMTQRKIPFYKVGGRIRFTNADLELFLQRNRIEVIGSK